MEIDNYGMKMIESYCWPGRLRIIFLLTLNAGNICQLGNLKMHFVEPLIFCFMIITSPAWNIKLFNSST